MIGQGVRRAALSVGVILDAAVLFAGFPATEVYLPAVGRVQGAGDPPSQFYSTVWATNLTSASETVTFEFLKQGQVNTTPTKFNDVLSPGQTKVYENIVENNFHLSNALGAARVTSTGEVFVSERIYNQYPGDDIGNTEGLFFAGVPKAFSITLGQTASIQGVNQGGSENFRYNFALIETGGGSPTVHVALLDDSGATLGAKDYVMQPYEQIQPNVAELLSTISTTNARIAATVTSGTGSILMAGAQVANESQDPSGFEMSFRGDLLGGNTGSAGVTSLNGLVGALSLTAGSGISVTPSGSQISIAYTGGGGSGLTSVTHDSSLAGEGTSGSPLAVANGQVVRSLNGLHDNLTLTAGTNVTITPSGSTLTIASSAGGGGLTLPYSGTTNSYGTPAFDVTNTGYGTHAFLAGGDAVYGEKTNGIGIHGFSTNSYGVEGDSLQGDAGVFGISYGSGPGVRGSGGTAWGVYGTIDGGFGATAGVNTGNNVGLYGESASGSGLYATSQTGYAVYAGGNFGGTGAKYFVEPHPVDPTKEIRYVCLEGPESGTYFRGTAHISGGFAKIPVPESFRDVTSPHGITVLVSPVGEPAALTVVRKGLDSIEIRGSADVEFDYMVNGVRKAFEGFEPISQNRDFVPLSPDDRRLTMGLPAESLRRLKATGILNEDGTVNLETAHRLGWDQQESWKRAQTPEK